MSKKHDFFGIYSQKVITFLELIPKKLYICIVNIRYYDQSIPFKNN